MDKYQVTVRLLAFFPLQWLHSVRKRKLSWLVGGINSQTPRLEFLLWFFFLQDMCEVCVLSWHSQLTATRNEAWSPRDTWSKRRWLTSTSLQHNMQFLQHFLLAYKLIFILLFSIQFSHLVHIKKKVKGLIQCCGFYSCN